MERGILLRENDLGSNRRKPIRQGWRLDFATQARGDFDSKQYFGGIGKELGKIIYALLTHGAESAGDIKRDFTSPDPWIICMASNLMA